MKVKQYKPNPRFKHLSLNDGAIMSSAIETVQLANHSAKLGHKDVDGRMDGSP